MCCGQKRRALALGQLPPRSLAPPPTKPPFESDARTNAVRTIDLLYLQQEPIQLRGMVTGRIYQFSRSQPVQPVDQRDATGFLRTPRLFRPTK
jgi:hypothetical protein